MSFVPMETREATRAFTLPDHPEKKKEFVNMIMKPYRLVLLMGLSSTGKSSFLNAYEGRPGWSLTRWNRDNIIDMFFDDGTRVEKFYNYVDELEGKLFPKLFVRECHQVAVEGWNRLPNSRSRYMNYMPQRMGRKAVFVFDGPIEEIIKRNQLRGSLDLSDEELPLFLQEQHEGIVWPTFDEGWNDIFYINTFGGRGATYLKERVL